MHDELYTLGRFVAVGCLLVALALVVVLVGASLADGTDTYVVLSQSMEPTLEPGDVVVVRSVPAGAIEAGDVVTYRETGPVGGPGPDRVTHRVVAVKRVDGHIAYRTKGDANERADSEWVNQSQVVGTAWFHVPYVGRFVHFAHRPLGQVLLVFLPGLLLVGSGVRTLFRSVAGRRA